jgi:hypothetical protein
MSRTEIDRMGVIRKVLEGRLSQVKAGDLLGLGARQVRRLATAYELEGPAGLASKKRGRPINYRLPEALQLRALETRRRAVRRLWTHPDTGECWSSNPAGSKRKRGRVAT